MGGAKQKAPILNNTSSLLEKLTAINPKAKSCNVIQDNVSDMEFLYDLCVKFGFLMAVKNDNIIITAKDAKGDASQTSNTSKNENLPTFTLNLTDIHSLEITEANRNSYTAVIVEWQDIEAGKVKSIKVRSAGACTLNVPE